MKRMLPWLISRYLNLVWRTKREAVFFAAHSLIEGRSETPSILASWHGQNYLLPFARRREDGPIKVLISRHRDARLIEQTLKQLGFEVILGSGAGVKRKDMVRKGGTAALINMIDALRSGTSIALTADVPKTPRVAGRGIIKLAFESNCPIIPMAVTTYPRRVWWRSWDHSTIPCLFSRIAYVIGDAIFVHESDEEALEVKRCELEIALNQLTAIAEEIADSNHTNNRSIRRVG